MKLRVAIVDDEQLARERLRRLLRADREVEIVAECPDGPSAVTAVEEHRPDLVFLDVQMPGLDGFGVLQALDHGRLPLVVFVTGFDQHAVRAFEEHALDYLVKPTNRARLERSLARARERLGARGSDATQLLALLREQAPAAGAVLKRFSIRQGERILFIPAHEVDWIEAAGNYAILHVGRITHILRETMTALETQLARENFLRVSRSAIVNLSRVRELQILSPAEQVAILQTGQSIPITRSLREMEERLRFA